MFASQAASIFRAAYVWGYGGASGGLTTENLIVMGYAVFVFPALGMLGLGWAIWGAYKRLESRKVAVALFVASLMMSTVILPLWASQGLGSLFRPWAEARAEQAARNDVASYYAERTTHYEALRQHFRTPQRVAGAQKGFLRLAGNHVIRMMDFAGTEECNQRFQSWTPLNLQGRDVRIVLPDREHFDQQYIPGLMTGFFELRPTDPETGTVYGIVPAIVVLYGEIVNVRFSRYAKLSEKFFREQVAKNM